MIVDLTPEQCRVIGVMLEKEITTPDQYPLSLNGLTTGCNQKSNREPVMQLSEVDVQNIVDDLKQKKQISEQTGFGSRVVKYKHRFCNTEFGSLKLTRQQLAIVCVLLLRGPQTPGELRTRTNRLAEFSSVEEVESTLEQLTNHNGEQLVLRLEREPGKRESRYVHLFSGSESHIANAEQNEPKASVSASKPDETQTRIASLEADVAELKMQVHKLTQLLDELM